MKRGNRIESEDVHAILCTEEIEELLLDWKLCHLQVFEGTAVEQFSVRENSMKIEWEKKPDHTRKNRN